MVLRAYIVIRAGRELSKQTTKSGLCQLLSPNIPFGVLKPTSLARLQLLPQLCQVVLRQDVTRLPAPSLVDIQVLWTLMAPREGVDH